MEDQYQGKNVLVTGGCGFIGSNLAISLVGMGANVTVLDSMLPRAGGNLFNLQPVSKKIHVNYSDLRDDHSLPFIIKNQDIIFNMAGQISHLDSMENPMADLDINCRAQLSLLEVCKIVNPSVRIVYASTRQIYGRPQILPVKEEHIIAPVDVNGINKAAGEWYHSLYHKVYGLNTVSLRLTNTFGPRQAIGLSNQGFMGVFIRKAIMKEKITLYGTGKQLRDLNYIDDVVSALLICGHQTAAIGRVFNLGHHDYYTLTELVDILNEITGVPHDKIPFPAEKAKIDIGDYYTDYTYIKNELGWVPQFSLRQGLKKTINYFSDNMDKYIDKDS